MTLFAVAPDDVGEILFGQAVDEFRGALAGALHADFDRIQHGFTMFDLRRLAYALGYETAVGRLTLDDLAGRDRVVSFDRPQGLLSGHRDA